MVYLISLVPLLPLLGVVINTLLGLRWLRQHRPASGASHGHHGADAHGTHHDDHAAAPTHEAHSGHADHGSHADYGGRLAGIIASAMVGLAFVCTVVVLFMMLGRPAAFEGTENGRFIDITYWDWMVAGDFSIPFGFLIDQLSLTMMLLVTGVGTLIHIYAIGYMSHDPRPIRFFTYLNLFIVAMLMLVMGNNFLMLFLGWEGVGLCSFLLIGFWFEQRDPPWASTKAFVVNRIGDFGLLMAMFAIWGLTQDAQNGGPLRSLLFRDVFENANTLLFTSTAVLGTQYTAAGAIALMLFLGVTGKSAQIPLFVWLPDAMAGPTPVSALIHAATMVTAGVYLIVRTNVIFELSPAVMNLVVFVGAATAFVGATTAIGQYDIKKVLAYSTVSQLGYMVAAVGMKAYVPGMFHLLTHGIFKALLFLAAGAVIHGYGHEQDMRKMGGLRHKMPKTFLVYMVGTLALAGIFPLAGFWSKDEIIGHAFDHEYRLAGYILVISSMMTAFYMARQVVLVFFGEQRDRTIEAHESPPLMLTPLYILAGLTVVAGLMNFPWWHMDFLHQWLSPIVAEPGITEEPAAFHLSIAVITTILALLSGFAGYRFYKRRLRRVKPNERDPLHHTTGVLYEVAEDKWYADDLYRSVIVNPFKWLAGFLGRIFDVLIIDGAVNGSAWLVGQSGRGLRTLQTGYVRTYALMFMLGVVAVVTYFALR